MTATAILLAAGSGERLARATPKAFVDLAGRPMVEWSLLAIQASSSVSTVVLVVPRHAVREAEGLAAAFRTVAAVVPGGSTRQDSVRIGLTAVPGDARLVLCHDAARPLAGPELFDRVAEAVPTFGAQGAVPGIPSPDTVKRVRGGGVVETIPRQEVVLVQTPQAFAGVALREAHARAADAGLEATDDAMLLEAAGHRVVVVEGAPDNFKVTTEQDLGRAEHVLVRRGLVRGGAAGG